MGLVELKGNATGPNLTAPFTNKPCICCEYTVEEYKKRGKHSGWETIKKERIGNNFTLKDETGEVLVEFSKAELSLEPSFEEVSIMGSDPSEQVQEFLRKQDIKFEGFLGFNKYMRYREYRIEEGKELYVLGTARRRKGGDGQTNAGDIVIGKGITHHISDKKENQNVQKARYTAIFLIVLGVALFLIFFSYIFLWLA